MRPSRRDAPRRRARLVPYLVVVVPLLLLVAQSGDTAFTAAWRWALVGGLVLLFGGDGKFLTLTTAVVLILATFVLAPAAVFRDRSFFGVTEVLRTDTETILMHGTTAHGRQELDPADPRRSRLVLREDRPDRRRVPGLGHPARRAGSSSTGLGAGAARRVRPTRRRPGVLRDRPARRAGRPRIRALFTYLRDRRAAGRRATSATAACSSRQSPTDSIDLADHGRLLVGCAARPPADARGDRRRAIARSRDRTGCSSIHVSNRYYDLAPPVNGGAASRRPRRSCERAYDADRTPSEAGAGASSPTGSSRARRMTRSTLEALTARRLDRPARRRTPLTDDFPDLLRWFGR